MILEEPGKQFELSVIGCEAPVYTDDHITAPNWLVVQVQADLPEGLYTASHASLLTWEVAGIAAWLKNIANRVPQTPEIEGMQPDIAFEHVRSQRDLVTIQIRVRRRLAPPWWDLDQRHGRGVLADFTVPREQFNAAAAALTCQLDVFPPRGGIEVTPGWWRRYWWPDVPDVGDG